MTKEEDAKKLEDLFPSCPECSAPWHLHWIYVWEGNEKKRRWNTCPLSREQLEAKWLDSRVDGAYPAEIIRRARVMNVHPERLLPHEGTRECDVCGCDPGGQHDLATHDANADLTGA